MNVVDVKDMSVCFNRTNQRIDNLKDFFILTAKKKLHSQPFWALRGVSFSLRKGDALGIVGLNGSGKSTLLKVVSGIITPTEGQVYTSGKIAPMIELGAGFDADLTACENIFLNGAVLGYKREYMRERVSEIIAFAELEDFQEMPIKNFSSGMTARLGFAIATVSQPDILILDEVLSVGDYKFQKKSMARTRAIIDGGATVLFVSHSPQQVREVCNRAIWLDAGKVVMAGSVDEVMAAYEPASD